MHRKYLQSLLVGCLGFTLLAQAAEATGDPVLIDLLDIVPQSILDNPDDSALLEAFRRTILEALDD